MTKRARYYRFNSQNYKLMDLPIRQFDKLLSSASYVLITGPKQPNVDILGAAYAWHIFLTSKKKKADIVFDGSVVDYKFWPAAIKVDKDLGNVNKFKIILDVSKTKVKQLSYDVNDQDLVIDVVPDGGTFSAGDVKTEQGEYKYDLVICLGADSLDVLGNVFTEHRHFFHNRPIINIDNAVLNENYGELNIVEATATSVSEISYHLLNKNLNTDMATCLLAGMIVATNSFQSPKVTPETLSLASELIIKGAQREEIIESLYRTKDIDTLKSWGKVLSRLRKQNNIIFSFLKHEELDYLPADFEEMVKELILSTPGAQVAVIFYQSELSETEAWIYTIANINALDLVKDLDGTGHRHLAKATLNYELNEARDLVTDKISQKLNIINSI